ncbi:MAG TPA: hypothetical protein VJ775_03465 [Sphingomicrobium sp.]|nr:hypothetical protein [Sphingomicrobium sp.]
MSSFPSRLRRLRSLAHFLYVQRIKGFDTPQRPVLDAASADWLAERLKATKLYLEFGSGGSTLLANRLGVPSVTVESDRYYAAVVRKALPSPEKARILTPPMGITREWGMPVFGKERKGPRYVWAPFNGLDRGFPDFIFVDGRYRVACVLECARQAARVNSKATVLMDDYERRPHYHVLEDHLGKPERVGRGAIFSVGDRPIPDELVGTYLKDPR